MAKSSQPLHPSTPESDRELAERFQRGDTDARDQLFERHLPLARRLATRYRHSNEDLEDLVQVAGMALLNAIERFDPQRGTEFTSYAIPTILGELKRHFRDHTWSVHVPRDLQERSLKISRTIDQLGTSLGRSPTISEVATKLDITVEEALDALRAADAYDALSFEAESVSAEGEGRQLSETIGDEDPHYDVVDYAASIEDTMTELPERERVVLYLRFVEDLTQTQIAERIGVSQMHVSRLIRRAVSALRESAEAGDTE
jgi:RNA polymerase sigma-B factor